MIVYDLKEQGLVVFSEKQKDKRLVTICRNDVFKDYTVTLYRGWNDKCNVTEVMEALDIILEPKEELSSEDILRACDDVGYGLNLKLGYYNYGLIVYRDVLDSIY